jgi:G3E family GTPase
MSLDIGTQPRKLAHLVLAGGFLGAGKTTLILAAGEHLRKRGTKVAIIANDQGGELVDSRMAGTAGFDAEEITGGCFCCRFSALMASAERLLAYEPDVIFAEPVGSCMDISATILQAVKKLFSDKFRLAPYTVLVDPARAQEMFAPDADPDLAYLFRNQLLEADLVVLTKADRGAVP